MLQQPCLRARLLLLRADLEPKDVKASELSQALVAAVDGGRADISRRVCVTGVRHGVATGDHASVQVFVAAGNSISAARRSAMNGSSQPVATPRNAVIGSASNAAASAVREVSPRDLPQFALF